MAGFISGYNVPSEDFGPLAPRIGPDAPDKMKLMIAKAVLPMPPAQLGVALAVLARNEAGEIGATAARSIVELPSNVVAQIVEDPEAAASVLDVFAHAFKDVFEPLRQLLRNEACADDTVRWMARTLRGEIIEFISRNQRRLIREPRIIEALIANPATPTPTLAPVIETALRNNVETGRIAGFRELAKAFFGDDLAQIEGSGPKPENAVGEVAPPEAIEEDATGADAPATLEVLLDKGEQEAAAAGADEPVLHEVQSLDKQDEVPAEEEDERSNLWASIQAMGVAGKVRLAVMGDGAARAILIRDPKKIVSSAVMKSPRLTLKEVAGFAATKTISEDVIREIARGREWTKNYSIRFALIKNPKCPPSQALTFLRGLRASDVRKMGKARDVPAYISRAARQQMARKG